jgi:hypothetical protein
MRIRGGETPFIRVASMAFAALLLMTGISVAEATVAPVPTSTAADLSQFQAGNIISDALFFDPNALTVDQIQAFLNAKVPACADGYTCLKNYTETTHTVAGNPMCGTYEGAANESAATIISRVGQLCGISAKVILVMLQKEQGLVQATSPSAGRFESRTPRPATPTTTASTTKCATAPTCSSATLSPLARAPERPGIPDMT